MATTVSTLISVIERPVGSWGQDDREMNQKMCILGTLDPARQGVSNGQAQHMI